MPVRSKTGTRRNVPKGASRRKTMRAARPASKGLRETIKKVVLASAEVKHIHVCPTQSSPGAPALVPFNTSISGLGDVFQLIPPIITGNDNNDRLGNIIRPKSLIVKGHVTLNAGGQAAHAVRVYVLTHKVYKSPSVLMANMGAETQVLQDSWNDIDVAFDGTLSALTRPLNAKRWTNIKTYTFKLAKDNSDPMGGRSYADFSCRIPTPATYLYDDDPASLPNNHAPVIAVGFARQDGTFLPPTDFPVLIQLDSYLAYTDM